MHVLRYVDGRVEGFMKLLNVWVGCNENIGMRLTLRVCDMIVCCLLAVAYFTACLFQYTGWLLYVLNKVWCAIMCFIMISKPLNRKESFRN